MTKSSFNLAGANAGAPSQRLTPRALLEVKRLNDPQFHPDGQRIAFTVQEADFEDSRWTSHIWITEWIPPDQAGEPALAVESLCANPDDEHGAPLEDQAPIADELTRQLTFSIEGETDPLWSPDGRYLAFLSSRPDTTVAPDDEDDEAPPAPQIWAMPMEGGEARRLTNTKDAILDFAWTPDGQSVIYLATEPRPRPIEAAQRDWDRRKMDPIVEHDDARRRQFWSIDVEERKPHLLFTADFGVETFALSPDGGRVAYLTNYTGEDNDYHIADLYLRDLESGATEKLVRREGGKYRLRWSPTGSQIAFISWHDPRISYSRESVYIAETASSETLAARPNSECPAPGMAIEGMAIESRAGASPQQDIRMAKPWIDAPGVAAARPASDLDNDVISFEWLDDHGVILALAAVGTSTHLYQFNDGRPGTADSAVQPSTSEMPLTAERADRRDLAVHRESGRAAWVGESGDSPPELVLRESDGREYVLTQLNAHFANSFRLPRQDVVSWASVDSHVIEGVLTYPLDYQPGERYPLIVQVHGGPKGRAADSLLDYAMPAIWASEGYLVLRPNYRGSEGYGHAFAVANRRDLGGRDFDDVMSGVDWCGERGLADGERIGIMGGSYGGYLVNWAIGHTDRFKAAISMFGIFHLQTDYSNSRLSRWEHDYMGAYYWEDPDIYRKLSPASYLERMQTPTLILHGDEDDNTSISNSREIYQALRQRGVASQFVHYPREGHGIQEPNHRLDELRRCLAWMDRHVRAPGGNIPVFRPGDKVPHGDGRLELCVVSAEITHFLGQQEARRQDNAPATILLEVVFTIRARDLRQQTESMTLSLADIQLRDNVGGAGEVSLPPAGVPLDVPGGKVLVEGDNLRIRQSPDPDTGQLAFAASVAFRVQNGGERLLYVADFPPVTVHWLEGDDDDRDAAAL